MRRLIPAPADPADHEWTPQEVADAYAYPAGDWPDGAWLRANMVGSVDGASRFDGRSEPLSGPPDKLVFGVLRALADVVLVGAETVRKEEYRPARGRAEFAGRRAAAGQAPAPAIAVVSASLDLDFDLPLFTDPLVPTLVLTGADAPPSGVAAAAAAGATVLVAGPGGAVDPARIKPELAARGHTRLLCEGGPRLLAQLAAGGALDELCLTITPRMVAGTVARVMDGPELPAPRELELTDLLTESGYLFGRYVVRDSWG
ncbi:pyrimidine reductase family protein [Streptomyces sp. B6B3]|uniref:pyrimidine reductase family protein n=1 Tax=Streptomyces sp. B6B3 TaxID=3153570 RepID=UPI00325F21AD